MSLHPRNDPLREEQAQLGGVEQELAARPRHPVGAPVGDVGRHHLQIDALRTEVPEGQRALVVLRREVVEEICEPRCQAGCPAVRGETGAEAEPVAAERAWQPEGDPGAERECEPEQGEKAPGDDCAHGERSLSRPEREHEEGDAGSDACDRGEREADERCSGDMHPLRHARPADAGREQPEVPACSHLRLEQPEEVVPVSDPRRERCQLLEATPLTAVLGCGGSGGGDRPRRRPADLREPVRHGELAERMRVDDATRDATLHHDVAGARGVRVVVRARIAARSVVPARDRHAATPASGAPAAASSGRSTWPSLRTRARRVEHPRGGFQRGRRGVSRTGRAPRAAA